jgi:hypothetical protein
LNSLEYNVEENCSIFDEIKQFLAIHDAFLKDIFFGTTSNLMILEYFSKLVAKSKNERLD